MKEIYTASSQKPIAIQDHSRLEHEHVLMAKKNQNRVHTKLIKCLLKTAILFGFSLL